MSLLFSYSKLILFALLVLLGVQVPGFVSAYGNNLEARLAESTNSIKPFQETANRHFNGDISKLINHYSAQQDNIIDEGADSIKDIFERFQALNTAALEFKNSEFNAYKQTFLAPVKDIRAQTWKRYNFNVLISKKAIGFGLIMAITLLIIVEIFFWCFKRIFAFRSSKKVT